MSEQNYLDDQLITSGQRGCNQDQRMWERATGRLE